MGTNASGGPAPGPVVVGVDGSAHAARAALWAAAEADRRGQPLHLVYAADTDGRALYLPAGTLAKVRDAGRAVLRDTAQEIAEHHPDLTVSMEPATGEPVTTLVETAGRHGTVVVGSRGLGGFTALLLGSVGLRVAAEAKGPVVVVRGADNAVETGVVLVAVRDAADFDVVRHAARAARLRKASLRMLHVWSVFRYVGSVVTMLDDVDEIAHDQEDEIAALADRVRKEFPGLAVTEDVDQAASVAGILVDSSRHADLLVMGGRRPAALTPPLGRVTHAVLHHAHCPVELIPRDDVPHHRRGDVTRDQRDHGETSGG